MTETTIRAALYARVSTAEQHAENQLPPLREYIEHRGWQKTYEFIDQASGATNKRPAYQELLAIARRRQVDAIVVWRLDRFGRSTQELVNVWAELQDLGVRFVSLSESIDFGTPTGKVMYTIISAMAEFERDRLRERIHLGLDRARRNGVRFGRPPTVPVEAIRKLRKQGIAAAQIARDLAVSRASVYRSLRPALDDARKLQSQMAKTAAATRANVSRLLR